MTAKDFAQSAASDDLPPTGISMAAQALWLTKAGKWDAAHDLCQQVRGIAGAWIHAYLHRQEGDLANAAYWYQRAGKAVPAATVSLHSEWESIAAELLS